MSWFGVIFNAKLNLKVHFYYVCDKNDAKSLRIAKKMHYLHEAEGYSPLGSPKDNERGDLQRVTTTDGKVISDSHKFIPHIKKSIER